MTRHIDVKFYDARGTEIKIDDSVAYNFSGEIAVGKVIEIKTSEKMLYGKYQTTPRIKIKREFPNVRDFQNKFSVVTSGRNLLVLKETLS